MLRHGQRPLTRVPSPPVRRTANSSTRDAKVATMSPSAHSIGATAGRIKICARALFHRSSGTRRLDNHWQVLVQPHIVEDVASAEISQRVAQTPIVCLAERIDNKQIHAVVDLSHQTLELVNQRQRLIKSDELVVVPRSCDSLRSV